MTPRRPALAAVLLLAAAMLATMALAACPRDPSAGAPAAAKPERASPPGARQDTAAGPPPGVRTGGPLPARPMPRPVQPDLRCSTDADCVVKDVGSCCGAYPACVNAASPANPAAVRAACAARGESSSCEAPAVTACRCEQGRCASETGHPPSP